MVEYKDVLGFEQEPLESADFASLKEAVEEARRCLNCAVPQCRKGCPINNEIPQFIHALAQGNIGEAAEHIAHNSCLPGISWAPSSNSIRKSARTNKSATCLPKDMKPSSSLPARL